MVILCQQFLLEKYRSKSPQALSDFLKFLLGNLLLINPFLIPHLQRANYDFFPNTAKAT